MTTSLQDNNPSSVSKTPERAAPRVRTVTPFVDVLENANELLLVADVPGASPEGVDVQIDKGELTLSARRGLGSDTGYAYRRSFVLPRGIDGSKVEAELTAGVLRVHLPKSDATKPRRIDVKAS